MTNYDRTTAQPKDAVAALKSMLNLLGSPELQGKTAGEQEQLLSEHSKALHSALMEEHLRTTRSEPVPTPRDLQP